MNNTIVTADLSEFGYRELDEGGKLLHAYAENGQPDFMSGGVTLNFNKNSGYVFLSDEDYNVAMLNDDGKLVQFFSCPECGNEGFDDKQGGEYEFEAYNGFCSHECSNKNQ